MAVRNVPLVNGEYYHIFNRGVAKMPIFRTSRDYQRFYNAMLYYQIDNPKPKFSLFTPNTFTIDTSKKIIEIVAYCLMPNHFHFLLKQTRDGGISEFISKLSNSYARYYNTKNKRVGSLLQGDFKAVHIDDTDQLLHVSRYIHLNPLIGYVVQDLNQHTWSSYYEYTESNARNICEKEIVLNHFISQIKYKEFVLDHIDYAKKLAQVKHLLHDVEA